MLQLVVLLVMPNKTARTLAALFATIAWVYTIRSAVRGGEGEDIFFGCDRRARAAGGLVRAACLADYLGAAGAGRGAG